MRPNHQKRAKIRQRIRALRAWRLTEALNLDEKSAVRLFPVLNKYDGKLHKLAQQSRTLRRQLRQELRKPQPDNRRVNQLINQSVKLQAQAFRLRNARFSDLRRVLTPPQAAKLMVVLPEIDRRIQRQIRRAMRQGRQGRAGRRGPRGLRKNPYGNQPNRRRRGPGRFKNPFDDGPPRGGPPPGAPRRGVKQPFDPGF